jgi:hypothetical protein
MIEMDRIDLRRFLQWCKNQHIILVDAEHIRGVTFDEIDEAYIYDELENINN